MNNERKTIIMVDDDLTNLTVAKNHLVNQYDVFTIPSGKKLFQILERVTPDLVLLDIDMPEMDGYDVIKVLKGSEMTAQVPVIFLTALTNPESEVKGLNMGAVDYIAKPFSQQLLMKRIELHLLYEAQKNELMEDNSNLKVVLCDKTNIIFGLQDTLLNTVAELVECRDSVTGGHIERTQEYLRLLVACLLRHDIYSNELKAWDIPLFVMSSQLHDVGKISIRDDILLKPGSLTVEEFTEMKKHTVFGSDIIAKIEKRSEENAFLRHAKILAASHHEKWDGSGYPYGLHGDNIPLEGRLMAIVDVYDALTNDRPYKKAFPHEKAVDIITSDTGTHFDPLLVDVFMKYEIEFKSILRANHGLPAEYIAVQSKKSCAKEAIA